MPARSGFDFRLLLIHLAANFNLVLGGLAVAFGLYVLLAGADAVATILQANDATNQAVAQVAPADEAKKIGNVMDLVSKGVAGVFLAMASVVAGCAIVQGVPHLLVGIGILFRQGWARVIGILFGILGLLQGLACLGSPGATRSVTVTGIVFTSYGLISLVGLFGSRASDFFSRRDLQPADGSTPTPSRDGQWALAGVLCSAVFVALACGLATMNLPGGAQKGPNAAQQSPGKLLGVWDFAGEDAHSIAFGKDGVFYFSTREGAAKGTYRIVGKDIVENEYELPDAVFQAQKLAFDLAKKAANNPNNPFKGIFNAIEPVRSVKNQVRFTLADADKSLTLHHAKGIATYRRNATDLVSFEAIFQHNAAAAAKKFGGPAKLDQLKTNATGTDEATYRSRLAELHDAIAKGQTSRIKELIKSGVGVNDRDEKGETPLMKAVQAGYLDIISLLFDQGADDSVTDREGNDFYYHAAAIGRFEWLVRGTVLQNTNQTGLKRGAGGRGPFYWPDHIMEPKTLKGMNGLMVAASHGQLSDLKFIHATRAAYGAGLENEFKKALRSQDRDGKSALDHALAKGHKDVVAWITHITGEREITKTPAKTKKVASAETTPKSDPKLIAFLNACATGDLEAADLALKDAKSVSVDRLRAFLHATDARLRTPLMLAAARGDVPQILLLTKAIRENDQFSLLDRIDSENQTVYHHAAINGDAEALKYLLVSLSTAWSKYESSGVHWFKVLKREDKGNKTAAEHAEMKGKNAAVEALKMYMEGQFKAATPCSWDKDANYHTALEIACYQGDLPTVKQLLKAGCPLKFTEHVYENSTLKTPLIEAAWKGQVLVVNVLLESFGKDDEKRLAYINIRNSTGHALYWAEANNQPEVAALLRKYGAK